MEATKMRGYVYPLGRGEGLCGIKFNSKCHLENPCAINGKQTPKWTSLLIFNYVVRRLLRNQLINLMEHGMNPKISMVDYGLNFIHPEVNFIHVNLLSLHSLHGWAREFIIV